MLQFEVAVLSSLGEVFSSDALDAVHLQAADRSAEELEGLRRVLNPSRLGTRRDDGVSPPHLGGEKLADSGASPPPNLAGSGPS